MILSRTVVAAAGILFATLADGPFTGTAAAFLFSIERPATVDALVAKLKTTALLRQLDTTPTSCSRVPKGVARDRCYYRAGDMEVLVAWYRESQRFSSIFISRIEPQGSLPFGWIGLADTISLLCGGLDSTQANAVVSSIPDRLSQATWYYRNQPVPAEHEGARRAIRLIPSAVCTVDFSETRAEGAIRATFSSNRFQVN